MTTAFASKRRNTPSEATMVPASRGNGTSETQRSKAPGWSTLQEDIANEPSRPVPRLVHDVLRSPAKYLDDRTRQSAEAGFGWNVSDVRIHTDERASKSANALNALAYTVGNDIVFGPGQYRVGTPEGDSLLVHELTHVVNQKFRGGAPSLQRQIDPRRREEEQPEWSEGIAISEAETMQEIVAAESRFAGVLPLLPPAVKSNLWLMNMGAGFGAGFITGLSTGPTGVNPQDLVDLVEGFQSNSSEFVQGYFIGKVMGVGEDIYDNLAAIPELAQLWLALTPIGLMYFETKEAIEWIRDPSGRATTYKRIAASLKAFEEYVRTNPSALLFEGRDLGFSVGEMASRYLYSMVVKEPNYKNKGIAIGRIVGIIATEIVLLFIGAGEVKAAGKGLCEAGRKAAALLKDTRFGKSVASVLEKARVAKTVEAASKAEKVVEGARAEKTAASVGSPVAHAEELPSEAQGKLGQTGLPSALEHEPKKPNISEAKAPLPKSPAEAPPEAKSVSPKKGEPGPRPKQRRWFEGGKRARRTASKRGIRRRKRLAYERMSSGKYDPLQDLLTADERERFLDSKGKDLPKDIDWHHTRQSSSDPAMADVPEHIQPLRIPREHIFGEHLGRPADVPTAGIRGDVTSPEKPIFDPNDPEVRTREYMPDEPAGEQPLEGFSEGESSARRPPNFRDIGKVRDPALKSRFDYEIRQPDGIYRREIATGKWIKFPKPSVD